VRHLSVVASSPSSPRCPLSPLELRRCTLPQEIPRSALPSPRGSRPPPPPHRPAAGSRRSSSLRRARARLLLAGLGPRPTSLLPHLPPLSLCQTPGGSRHSSWIVAGGYLLPYIVLLFSPASHCSSSLSCIALLSCAHLHRGRSQAPLPALAALPCAHLHRVECCCVVAFLRSCSM
jgi:hypothetical protein